MAGSFGFESGKHEVSMRIAEGALLPHLREADPAAPVLADGFSCREQIEQATGRATRHAAEVTAEAMGLRIDRRDLATPWRKHLLVAAIAGVAAGALAALIRRRTRRRPLPAR
jgi:hypothetical protein